MNFLADFDYWEYDDGVLALLRVGIKPPEPYGRYPPLLWVRSGDGCIENLRSGSS